MRSYFLCDVHIPPRLASILRARGFEATHVFDIGLGTTDDLAIWEYAGNSEAIIITKDKDFVRLDLMQPGPRVVLICLGNCTNRKLIDQFTSALPEILHHFESGQGLVELR